MAKYTNIHTYLKRRNDLALIAEQRLRSSSAQFRKSLSELRQTTSAQLETFQSDIESHKNQLKGLAEESDPHQVIELTKLEAFELWLQRTPQTDEQVSAKSLLYRVTSKVHHTFRNLKAELQQAISENDDLQEILEQQEEVASGHLQWENLLELNTIKDPSNSIAATMKFLPPSISIFQYYKAYKPLILKESALPDIRNKIEISEEQFHMLWVKANSSTKDLLVVMWILKDLTIPKGVVEINTANPNFYLTRFCVTALNHIAKHYEEFYSNIENRKSLP